MVVIALLIGALSIAGAVDLIVDLDQPFEAMIVVSAEPMQEALAQMNAVSHASCNTLRWKRSTNSVTTAA